MNDDFLSRARMALDDMQGRVEGGKLAMFGRTIDYAERLEAENADMLEALEAFLDNYPAGISDPLNEAARKARTVIAKAKAKGGDA